MKVSRITKVGSYFCLVGAVFVLLSFLATQGKIIQEVTSERNLSFLFLGMVFLYFGIGILFYRLGSMRIEKKLSSEVARLRSLMVGQEEEIRRLKGELALVEKKKSD